MPISDKGSCIVLVKFERGFNGDIIKYENLNSHYRNKSSRKHLYTNTWRHSQWMDSGHAVGIVLY